MTTDVQGCSTCPKGEEQYESFTSRTGEERVQYDYRTHNGKLFSCVAKTLDEARERAATWRSGIAQETGMNVITTDGVRAIENAIGKTISEENAYRAIRWIRSEYIRRNKYDSPFGPGVFVWEALEALGITPENAI